MNNLETAIIKETEERFNKKMELINTPAKLAEYCTRSKTKYKHPEKSIPRKFKRDMDKEIVEVKAKIKEISEAPDFAGEFIITVEWIRSRTWGANPRAYTNKGFESSSIGGCGYDKLSTATAQALNSNKSILKMMYAKKNENISIRNHELLGYGSGYGILPSFEGGVGTRSHIRIIEGLGLKMETITSTKNTDVFLIKKA